jgi:hypothetical protein
VIGSDLIELPDAAARRYNLSKFDGLVALELCIAARISCFKEMTMFNPR